MLTECNKIQRINAMMNNMDGPQFSASSSSLSSLPQGHGDAWDRQHGGLGSVGLGYRMMGSRQGLGTLLWAVIPTVLAIGTGFLMYHLTGDDIVNPNCSI